MDDMTREEEKGVEELAKTIVTILSAGTPGVGSKHDSQNERASAIAEVAELNRFMDSSMMSDDSLDDEDIEGRDEEDTASLNESQWLRGTLGEDGEIEYVQSPTILIIVALIRLL